VAARLIADAFDRVDHEERGVCLGGAGDHVLDELAVARCVDEADLAAVLTK